MSFDTKTACHDKPGNYKDCLEGAFNVSSGGIDQASDYQVLIVGLTATVILMGMGWIIMSIYNSWASGSFNFNELTTRITRTIVIMSILSWLILGQ